MNVILSYFKCQDDWQDDKNVIKGAYAKLLNGRVTKKCVRYSEKNETIK